MKQTENNEIDLLLRNLAKRVESRSVSGVSSAGDQASVAHLDVDELNAFAERTLPAGARARYTAHLVDCSRCRKIVAGLTAAAGIPVSESESGEQTGTTFWQKFGALLSPPVLRYAVPALALLAVITVGMFSLRQQRRADFVAQNQEAGSSLPSSKTEARKLGKPEAEAPANAGQSQKTAATGADQQTKSGEKSEAGQDAATVDSVSDVPAKDANKPAAAAEAQPSFAPEPAPAPPPARPQTAAAADAKKNEEVAKQKEQDRAGAVSEEKKDENSNAVAAEREAALTRSRKAAAAGRGGSRSEARRGEDEQAKRADDDGETRAVEGRRFRKQGNTWVDTAYDASRPAMTIVRGSEQYRVLVADEPGIRAVAEKLSGEVILVWKGRAYRIR